MRHLTSSPRGLLPKWKKSTTPNHSFPSAHLQAANHATNSRLARCFQFPSPHAHPCAVMPSRMCAATRLRIRHFGIGHARAMPRAICILCTMHWTSLSITQRGVCVPPASRKQSAKHFSIAQGFATCRLHGEALGFALGNGEVGRIGRVRRVGQWFHEIHQKSFAKAILQGKPRHLPSAKLSGISFLKIKCPTRPTRPRPEGHGLYAERNGGSHNQ